MPAGKPEGVSEGAWLRGMISKGGSTLQLLQAGDQPLAVACWEGFEVGLNGGTFSNFCFRWLPFEHYAERPVLGGLHTIATTKHGAISSEGPFTGNSFAMCHVRVFVLRVLFRPSVEKSRS